MRGKLNFKINRKRGVAPVIATLLLVAVAVVGGTIIFTFSQGFFSAAQISGSPSVDVISILGYDARTIAELQSHDGNDMALDSGGNNNPQKEIDERIAVYIRSDSPHPIQITELRFGGTVYDYTTISGNTISDWNDLVDLTPGRYSILTKSPDEILTLDDSLLQPGQAATILIDLDSDLRIGRATQFKMTTSNSGVYVGTILVGQQKG